MQLSPDTAMLIGMISENKLLNLNITARIYAVIKAM
jgi:hypothetical protein